MTLVTINNQFDSNMQSIEVNSSVFLKIIHLIKNPLIIPEKSQIPQWKFCTINGNKRCTENIGSTDVLILDFDSDSYTIKEFEESYKAFKYILHTSHSYNGQNNKFRVLLFLDKTYEVNRLFYKCHDKTFSPYNFLLNHFNNVDPASFVKAQFFKMPAVKAPGAPYYFNVHDGAKWSPESIEGFSFAYSLCEQKQEEYYRKIEESHKTSRSQSEDLSRAMKYIKEKLETIPDGERHMKVFSLASWFSKIGGTYQEFSSIQPPRWADRNYFKQIKRLRNEWNRLAR